MVVTTRTTGAALHCYPHHLMANLVCMVLGSRCVEGLVMIDMNTREDGQAGLCRCCIGFWGPEARWTDLWAGGDFVGVGDCGMGLVDFGVDPVVMNLSRAQSRGGGRIVPPGMTANRLTAGRWNSK